jgi:hypothetical protein
MSRVRGRLERLERNEADRKAREAPNVFDIMLDVLLGGPVPAGLNPTEQALVDLARKSAFGEEAPNQERDPVGVG